MTPTGLLNWMLQSTALLGLCWAFYYLVLRHERLFQFNRGFLLLAPLLTAVLPLLPLPGWLSPAPVLPAGLLRFSLWLPEVQVGPDHSAAGPALPWLPVLYGWGLAASLLWQLSRLVWLSQLLRRLPRQAAAGYTLRLTGGRLPTSSFGRTVLWDDAAPLTSAQAAQVLAHELAHVRLGHTADRLWLHLCQAVLWFNPFVHLCARALNLTHEYQADAAALQSTPTASTAYTSLLARQAVSALGIRLPFAHSFSTSQTLNRIHMLHHPPPARRWKPWLALPLSALLLAAVACDKAAYAPEPGTSEALGRSNLVAPPPPPPAPPAPARLTDLGRVYDQVDQMPEYSGGMAQLMQDLGNGVKYPAAAKAAQLGGKVFISFVVGPDGEMYNPQVRKGVQAPAGQEALAAELNAEALRAVQQLPSTWEPGRKGGKPVAVEFTLPITFAP
ncbi:M56 family metallopeptidase [Hymenobacter coalescens]